MHKNVLNFDFLVEEGVINPEDTELISYAESAQEAWEQILMWYEACGRRSLAHRALVVQRFFFLFLFDCCRLLFL